MKASFESNSTESAAPQLMGPFSGYDDHTTGDTIRKIFALTRIGLDGIGFQLQYLKGLMIADKLNLQWTLEKVSKKILSPSLTVSMISALQLGAAFVISHLNNLTRSVRIFSWVLILDTAFLDILIGKVAFKECMNRSPSESYQALSRSFENNSKVTPKKLMVALGSKWAAAVVYAGLTKSLLSEDQNTYGSLTELGVGLISWLGDEIIMKSVACNAKPEAEDKEPNPVVERQPENLGILAATWRKLSPFRNWVSPIPLFTPLENGIEKAAIAAARYLGRSFSCTESPGLSLQ